MWPVYMVLVFAVVICVCGVYRITDSNNKAISRKSSEMI